MSIAETKGQCSITTMIQIPDNGITTLQFAVSGLVDNNLASPTQGICGVSIDFMHEYLGDLTISLISPSGTRVDLIGPPTTAITPTNLSRWNIEFIPCGSTPAPDGAFAAMWSNLQPWQAITNYTGTYHPQSGCLENFNTGSANGIWQIIIQDHDLFQIGSINSITLTFCNPAGLLCMECGPNAGTLTPTSFTLCSGENLNSSNISVNFGGNTPSPSLYNYDYILLSGNTVLQNGTSFSFALPAGNYTICGLSYLINDSVAINTLLATGDYNTLVQSAMTGIVCAAVTPSCVTVNVLAQPDTILISSNLCNGEVFTFGGQTFASTGTFYQVHDGPGLCDTIFEIRIVPRNLSILVDDPGLLTCGGGSLNLSATASGSVGPYSYQWSTVVGSITSPPNFPTISVNQPGPYFVSVTEGICSGTGSVEVQADQNFPQIFVDGGTITCLQPIINISPIYVPSDGTILWTGPSGFTSIQPNISVSVPGTYILNVTNASGCSSSKSVDILSDTTTAPFQILILGKDCQNGIATLGSSVEDRVVSWSWTGPNNFISTYWRPEVSDAGLYTLRLLFLNGCERNTSFFFDGDFNIPDLMLSPRDTLNCSEVITLTISSTTPGITYSWNGPHNFSSSLPTILISEPGDYLGTVYLTNGCRNSDIVTVELGNDVFIFQTFTDTLTCVETSVTIGVTAPQADIFEWINYSGPGNDQPMITVGTPGVYTLLMTDSNSGCMITTNIVVSADYRYTQFGYMTDTITCNNPIANLSFVPFAGFTYTTIYWELPDFTVVPGPTLMSGLSGVHKLFATAPNGCLGLWIIQIPFDTIPPFLILETDTLKCADTVQILSQSLDSIFTYTWNGPGIVSSQNESITVDKPGVYSVSAYSENGCPGTYAIEVDSNFVLPVYTFELDSLRCDRDAELSAVTIDDIISYAWFDPSGQLISTDSLIQVNQPGEYTFQIRGANNCIAFDTILMDSLVFPIINLTSDTFTCVEIMAQITAEIDINPIFFEWSDFNGNSISSVLSIPVSQSGPFIALAIGQNACESRDTLLVPSDTIPPVATIDLIGELRCQNRDVMFGASSSLPTPLLYSWSTMGGNILSNTSIPLIQANDTGIYVLMIQRLDNGCSDTVSYHLMEHPDAITLAQLDITLPMCNGEANATIGVVDVQGGISPFLFQMNGGAPQTTPIFNAISAGTYLLTITDVEGCVYDTTILIEPSEEFIVDAGPDLEIYLGESILLSGMTDLQIGGIFSTQWDSLGILLCSDCPEFEVQPLETSTYSYRVTSSTGCVRTDQVIVYVVQKGKFFIANIFSPNGDNINDEIRLHPSPGIEKVLQWIIFDRWGNAVFGKTNFDPGDPTVFWNGQTSTGEYTNPGVFPYVIEFQLINGKREVHHGDITLIR